jgi:hypothetical protein
MEVFVKPIMFFIFVSLFLVFLNIVFIFVSYNNVAIILEEATIIVEKNGNNTQLIKQELNDLMYKYNNKYTYKTEFINQQNFLESTRIVISKEYKYIGRNKYINIEKTSIAMNKQM